jgi:hypothetical protein
VRAEEEQARESRGGRAGEGGVDVNHCNRKDGRSKVEKKGKRKQDKFHELSKQQVGTIRHGGVAATTADQTRHEDLLV